MAQRYNAPDNADVLHYVTLKVRDRRRAFGSDTYAHLALDQLRISCDNHPAEITAYVVMPDHLHFILRLADGRLSRFLSSYKSKVTGRVMELAEDQKHLRRLGWLTSKGEPELWQDGKHSFHLWSGYMIRQKIRYIHDNPVRAGLVERPQDYPWSSVAAYVESGLEPPIKVDATW